MFLLKSLLIKDLFTLPYFQHLYKNKTIFHLNFLKQSSYLSRIFVSQNRILIKKKAKCKNHV